MTTILGAIEIGGTKILCAVGTADHMIARTRIETTTPQAAISAISAFFTEGEVRHPPISALGVGSFGPLELDPSSPHFGGLTTTPKLGWAGFPLYSALTAHLGIPIAIDTDVNTAALAEARAGNVGSLAYVTVGTGLGVGFASSNGIIRGLRHAEAGHLYPRRHELHGNFAGTCPYHGDCYEGLASGTAIAAAWGAPLSDLPVDHPAWQVEADYLGQFAAAIALMAAPDRIVFGGGVMTQPAVLPAMRSRMRHWLGGYLREFVDEAATAGHVVAPTCSEPPGLTGAFYLAASLLR